MVDVSSYLARINYSGPTTPTLETLCAIHHAHMMAVPFEDLDISLSRKISLDEDALLHKIVDRRRGGFCYELNGTLASLLRALGFEVTLLSAKVARDNGAEGPEFDHLALRVDFPASDFRGGGDPWLADVGFGDSFLKPLRLKAEIEQPDPSGVFRLVQLEERLQLERVHSSGVWRRQYSFGLQPRRLSDFAGMCHYHQTSQESHFTQNVICTRATEEGRITLSGMKLIVARPDGREVTVLASEEERRRVLEKYFDIVL